MINLIHPIGVFVKKDVLGVFYLCAFSKEDNLLLKDEIFVFIDKPNQSKCWIRYLVVQEIKNVRNIVGAWISTPLGCRRVYREGYEVLEDYVKEFVDEENLHDK